MCTIYYVYYILYTHAYSKLKLTYYYKIKTIYEWNYATKSYQLAVKFAYKSALAK